MCENAINPEGSSGDDLPGETDIPSTPSAPPNSDTTDYGSIEISFNFQAVPIEIVNDKT